MTVGLDIFCYSCFRRRDACSDPPPPPPHPFRGPTRHGSSLSIGAASPSKATARLGRSAGEADISSAPPTLEGVSPNSGSPTNSRHNVTPEETSLSLLGKSMHTHRPLEPESPLKAPVDEAQNNREPDKSAITADEISIPAKLYEQWTADDILRDISGDTEVSGPSWDPESDLDSLRGPLPEPETGDCRSDNPDTSERTRALLKRGLLVPLLIYMLLVRVCGIVTRLFEQNPLPGRTRVRWRCVSYSSYVLLIHK